MKLTLILILTFSTALFAKNEEAFKERKVKQLANIDRQLQSLNTLKSCISKATKGSEMKPCYKARRSFIKENKSKMKEFRQSMKEKRKELRAKRRAEKKAEAEAEAQN